MKNKHFIFNLVEDILFFRSCRETHCFSPKNPSPWISNGPFLTNIFILQPARNGRNDNRYWYYRSKRVIKKAIVRNNQEVICPLPDMNGWIPQPWIGKQHGYHLTLSVDNKTFDNHIIYEIQCPSCPDTVSILHYVSLKGGQETLLEYS